MGSQAASLAVSKEAFLCKEVCRKESKCEDQAQILVRQTTEQTAYLNIKPLPSILYFCIKAEVIDRKTGVENELELEISRANPSEVISMQKSGTWCQFNVLPLCCGKTAHTDG